MMLNDRQELPTEHKEREEQTNSDNNLDNCAHHLVRPQVVTYMIKVTALWAPAHISPPIVQRESRQHFQAFTEITYIHGRKQITSMNLKDLHLIQFPLRSESLIQN